MYIPYDKFARRAKREGYRARSAYKLMDLQRKFRIMKSGDFVVDLGASPGSWLQTASKIVGNKGKVLGVDTTPIVPFKDGLADPIFTLEKDIFDKDLPAQILDHFGGKIDVLLSDAAPSTTGIPGRDQALSYELATRSLEIAIDVLKDSGHAVVKIFEGKETPLVLSEARKNFANVKIVKPQGSQKTSKEAYIIALQLCIKLAS